jgi:hypothetical protein
MVPQSYDKDVIRQIADMGHEIGYHYEDMDFASSSVRTPMEKIKVLPKGRLRRKLREEDLYDRAIEIFKENLETLRKLYPVKTICMHGSPLSRFDNKAVWKKYKYRDFGVIGEPYFDIDFSDVFYITDTGRRWDGEKVSIRDKVVGGTANKFSHLSFHSTQEIIDAVDANKLPDRIMMTFHPQRWNDQIFPWIKEFVMQNVKNQVKSLMVSKSSL